MIKTIKPIIIPESEIYEHYLNKNSYSNDDNEWTITKSQNNDEILAIIDCKPFTKNYYIGNIKYDWTRISSDEIELPPPDWILAKLYSLSKLLSDCIVYHFIPYFAWVLQVDDSEIVIIKLDNINTTYAFYYQVQIIDIECINFPTRLFQIKIDV